MISYSYDLANATIYTKVTGIVDASQAIEHLKKLVEDPSILTGSREIVDLSNVDDLSLKYTQIVSIQIAFEALIKSGKSLKTKFIVSNDLQYGIARMLQDTLGDDEHTIEVERKDETSL